MTAFYILGRVLFKQITLVNAETDKQLCRSQATFSSKHLVFSATAIPDCMWTV